jgi:mono/diheme cytochrome c family protein
MSNETLFYVLGGALVVIALVVSFGGLRFEKFPGSRGLLVGATLAVAALVGATMVFAWRNAEDEEAHREAELAHAAEEEEAAGETTEADETAGTDAPEETAEPEGPTTTAATADGAQVFTDAGCGGCHTLAAAGTTGTTGPVLDASLKGKDEAYIRTSIVDPNDFIANNFPPDVMPQNYGEDLSPEELDALVSYLAESTDGQG